MEIFSVSSTAWQEPRQVRGQSIPTPNCAVNENDIEGRTVVASDGRRAYLFTAESYIYSSSTLHCLDLSSLRCQKIIPTNAEFPGYYTSAMVCYRRKLVIYERKEPSVFDLNTSESE